MRINDSIIKWLLEGDPAIRWQVHKDLLSSSKKIIENERKSTENEGWCKKLLDKQDKNGVFGGGLYGPKWISTTYTMLLLKDLGLVQDNKGAQLSCKILLDKGFYRDGGISYFKSMNCSEICVTGIILSILSYFKYRDERLKDITGHLLEKQMPDGGWNCLYYRGAVHSSFHTTINVLEGLLEYEKAFDNKSSKLINARKKGAEFLLEHKLFRSHTTGKIVDNRMLMLSFPARWRYDILRVLDYFQKSKTAWDSRMSDALEIIIKKRSKDGTWKLQNKHPGKVYFDLEKPGFPSRMNTLRCLRVLSNYK